MMTTPEPSLSKFLDSVSSRKHVVFDFETTSLTPRTGEIKGVAVSTIDGDFWFPGDDGRPVLEDICKREDAWLIAHNMIFDYKWLKYKWGIEPKCQLVCTMIAAWLLDENYKQYSLDHLVKRFFDHDMIPYKAIAEMEGTLFEHGAEVPTLEEYAKEDSHFTFLLFQALLKALEEQGLLRVLLELEMDVAKYIADMEYNGIKVDPKELSDFRIRVRGDIEKVTKKIYDTVGKKFLLTSSQQVSGVLFGEKKDGGLEYPTSITKGARVEDITKKGKSGFYGTGAAVLKKLVREVKRKDKVPEMLLEHRELTKFIDSFAEPFIHFIKDSPDGRIHPSFHQVRTVTGRLSASQPNLQQMPTRGSFRNVFVPEEGRIFIGLDFSQIELRILAHLSKEPRMMEAFNRGEDIHATTQRLLKTDDRRHAKVINFGIVYGMGANSLAEQAGISKRKAYQFIDAFFSQYSGIKRFMDHMREKLYKEEPYVLLSGRYRRVLCDRSMDDYERERAFRQYFNSAIQGGAADIMGVAIKRIHQFFQDHPEIDCKPLIQVHDELLFSIDERHHPFQTYCKIAKFMEGAVKLRVPVVVDGYIGKRWVKAMTCPEKCGAHKDDEIDIREHVAKAWDPDDKQEYVVTSCCGAKICYA